MSDNRPETMEQAEAVVMPEEQPIVVTRQTIGEQLLRGRRAKKVTIKHVSAALNIREDYLEALEQDDFEALPGKAYVVGFLRVYAQYLELDGGKLVAQLREQEIEDTRLIMPEPIESSTMPSRLLIFATLSVALVAVGFWIMQERQNRQLLLAQAQSTAAETLLAPQQPEPAFTPAVAAPAQQATAQNPVTMAETVPAQPSGITPETAPLPEPAAPVAEQPAETAEPVAAIPQNVRLVARERVWIQVKLPEQNNRVIYDKVMSPGMDYTLEAGQKAVVDIGKPEALDIYLGEALLGHINSTSVIRGFALDAESLQNARNQFSNAG